MTSGVRRRAEGSRAGEATHPQDGVGTKAEDAVAAATAGATPPKPDRPRRVTSPCKAVTKPRRGKC